MFGARYFFKLMDEAGEGGEGGGGQGPEVTAEVQALIAAEVAKATSGLKAKNSELLGALKQAKENAARFEGIDPDAVRGILSKFANDEEAGLIAAGKLDEVLNKRTERMKAGFDKETKAERDARVVAEARADKFSRRVLENGIRAEATAAGLHQYAIDDALLRANSAFQLDDEGSPVAKEGMYGKDGNPLTLKEWFADMKDKAPHWFPAPASGSGAGHGGGSGQKNTITRTQYEAMSPADQRAAVQAKIKVVD